ncbi:hypothetical protein TNCV_3268541 [Trichonephila clavipes]|nr:hypothetical protein TNCV_3268541 [Trichonephila clavipes]
MMPYVLNWEQIWKSNRSGKDGSEVVATLWHPCCVWPRTVLLINGLWEPGQEWQHMRLKDVMDVPLTCHCDMDQNNRGDRVP